MYVVRGYQSHPWGQNRPQLLRTTSNQGTTSSDRDSAEPHTQYLSRWIWTTTAHPLSGPSPSASSSPVAPVQPPRLRLRFRCPGPGPGPGPGQRRPSNETMNQPHLNMVLGCGSRSSSIPIRAVRPGSWAAFQGQCHHPVTHIQTHTHARTHTCVMMHSTQSTYPLTYHWAGCRTCRSRTWTAGWMARTPFVSCQQGRRQPMWSEAGTRSRTAR